MHILQSIKTNYVLNKKCKCTWAMPDIMYTGATVLSENSLKILTFYDIVLVFFKIMVQNFFILST